MSVAAKANDALRASLGSRRGTEDIVTVTDAMYAHGHDFVAEAMRALQSTTNFDDDPATRSGGRLTIRGVPCRWQVQCWHPSLKTKAAPTATKVTRILTVGLASDFA